MCISSTYLKAALLLLYSSASTANYINADTVRELTERTLGKGNQFEISLSFTNLDGSECTNCTVCSVSSDVHALYDGNPRTQLCTKCDVAETCPDDYYVHADLSFDYRWPMNYFKLTSSQNSGRDPEEVWLMGSRNDGKTWEELDHISSLSFSDRKQDKIITFDNKVYYTKYRLTLRKGEDKTTMELSNYIFASDFLSKFVTDLIYNVVKIQFFSPDIITLYQNNRVGEITEPAQNYEVSCVVHPFADDGELRSVLRFTSHAGYNSGYYGARSPFIAISRNDYAGGTDGLELVLWMGSNINTDQFRWTNKSLKLNENNKLKFVVLGDKARLYVDDELTATFVIPMSERPNFPRLYAYASDNFYTAANAQLKHLVYTPISLTEESQGVRFKPSIIKVVKNVKISTILEPHNEYELSFKYNPLSSSRLLTSILRFTTDETGSIDDADGHNIPFIGLYPDSYNLLLDYATETNSAWQYPAELVPKTDNDIKIMVLGDNIMLYVNNIYAGSLPHPLINRPFYEKIHVFASDNIHKEASGTLSYVNYRPLHTNSYATIFSKISTVPALSRYNYIGYLDQVPTSEYIISTLLFAQRPASNNGYSIFRFTSFSNAYNDQTVYGARCPMLHYQSGTTKPGMSIVSQNEDGSVKEQSIGFKSDIPKGQEIPVTLVSINNKISLYVNGDLVDTATAPLVERPPFKRLYVFSSTSYQDFFLGDVHQLEYTPLYKSNQVVIQPNGSTLRLSPSYKIGTVTNPRLTNLYEISFTITPYTIYNDWRSILRFTRPSGTDESKYGDRAPALWFLPSTRRIHFAQGSTDDPISYFQTEAALSYNVESNIRIITQEDGIISLYVNDQPAGSMYVPLASRPPIETLEVYTGDQFYPVASADISHLTYRHIYANAGNEFLMSHGIKPTKNNLIGEISNPASEYTISCIIHPVGTTNGFTHVFRFSRVSPTNFHVYGDRYASFWMQPNSYKARFHVGTVSDPNSIVPEGDIVFEANKDNDVEIVVREGLLKIYVNGETFASRPLQLSDYPPLQKLMVYAGDSFYVPAKVLIRQLKYTPVYTSASTYKFLHSALTARRNNMLAVIQHPSQTYTISCTIKPNGLTNEMSSIFRFSRVGLADVDFYGDRAPALLLKPDSYELILSQGSTANPNHQIDVTTKLNAGVDNTIKIVSSDDERLTIYVNDVMSGSAYIPLDDRPNLDQLLVYVGDPYYPAANVQVSNLLYEPLLKQEPVVKFLPTFVQPQKQDYIGMIQNPSDNYIISATIKPFGTMNVFGQFFVFKVKPFQQNSKYGDKFPALFSDKNSMKLFFKYILNNAEQVQSAITASGLIMNYENQVRIESIGEKVTLFINDVEMTSAVIPSAKRPGLSEPLYVFTNDGFHGSAPVYIKDLTYTPIDPQEETTFAPATLTLVKNNKIGQLVQPSSHYVISSTIKPLGTVEGWSCLFRFTADPSSNAEKYGDRNPLLMFHSGNYDLHSTVMFSGNKNYKNMYNMKGIIADEENDVKIVAHGDEISYFVNDEKVGSMFTPIADRPQLDLLHVYTADNFYNPANAQVTNLIFTPILPGTSSINFYPKKITIQKNNRIGNIIAPSKNFKVSFTVKPRSIKSGLSSILQLGRKGMTDAEHYGDRVAGFFLASDTNQLIASSISARGDINNIMTSDALDLDENNDVEYVVHEDTLALYVNGAEVGSVASSIANRPVLDEVEVYVGDPFSQEADAVVKHLVYTPLESSTDTSISDPISFLPATITLSQGNKVGQITKPLSQYIVSLNIKPLGTIDGWSNIIRFTNDPAADGTLGSRSPTLWFHHNSYDLHLSVWDSKGARNLFNIKGMVEYEEKNVKIVSIGHSIKLYIDDVNVGEIYSPLSDRPALDILHVYASDGIKPAANAEISNLVYTPIPDIWSDPFYPIEQGFCLHRNGGDQNSGVIDLGSLTAATWIEQQQECKEKCIAEIQKGFYSATGCEALKASKSCTLHTQPVAKGNGNKDHVCWVAGAPGPFRSEAGVCYNQNGNTNEYTYRTRLEDADNENKCYRKCLEYYDQATFSEKENISGCQRDIGNACFVYHTPNYIASMGNGLAAHTCWIKDNYQCSGDQCECGSTNIFKDDYRGTISRTQQGQPCQRWDTKSPHYHSYNPKSSGLNANYCRNPGRDKERPWCYTTDPGKQWDYCDIPSCPCGTLSKKKEDYRGQLSTTSSGRTCQDWNTQTVHTHDRTSANYPLAGLEANYCRNPGSKATPWCYTTDPAVPFDACNVPTCDPIMKVRVYVDTLYNICDMDGWGDGTDAHVKVYVNGAYCGKTGVVYDQNPTYFRQYFYCGTHNKYTSLRVKFYAYDYDGDSSDGEFLGSTNDLYNSDLDYSGVATMYNGACSGMSISFATKLYF